MALTDYKWTKLNLKNDCRFRLGFASLDKLHCGSIPCIPLCTNWKSLLNIVLAAVNYLISPETFTLHIGYLSEENAQVKKYISLISEGPLFVCEWHTTPLKLQGHLG